MSKTLPLPTAVVPSEFAMLRVEGDLKVLVRLLDVKPAYGKFRYEVSPAHGTGKKWVDSDRLFPVLDDADTA